MEIDDPKETKILIKTKARKFKGKDAKDTNDIYINSLISREVEMPIINIGENLVDTMTRILASEIEGKCTIEGYIKPNSVKIISYTSGLILTDKIIFMVSLECKICCPVEGMVINCIAKNITKAGIRAEINDINNPVLIFVARDHNFMSSYFNSIEENNNINVKVIGQRFELNDKYISIIGELVEKTASIIKPKKLPKLVLKP
jgi:DNA-directed RNA polymerase subunit E'/Rpb7